MQEATYTIKAVEFHRSGSNDKTEISATLFSFTADNEFNRLSFVIGPSEIQFSEIDRKDSIDQEELLIEID